MGQAATCDTPVCKPSESLLTDGPVCIPTWNEELDKHPDLGGCQPCPRNQTVKVDIARILDEGSANLEFQKPLKPVAQQLEELRARIAKEEQRKRPDHTGIERFPEIRRWDDRNNTPVNTFVQTASRNEASRNDMGSQGPGSDDILFEVAAALRGARKAAETVPPQAPLQPQSAAPPHNAVASAPCARREAKPAEVNLLLLECERIRQEERQWHAKQAARKAPCEESKESKDEMASPPPAESAVAPVTASPTLPVSEAQHNPMADDHPVLVTKDEPQQAPPQESKKQDKAVARGRAASAAAAARRFFSSKQRRTTGRSHE